MKCNRWRKCEFLYFVSQGQRVGKGNRETFMPCLAASMEEGRPRERNCGESPSLVGDCFMAEVFLACTIVLKIEWVSGNCFLDQGHVAESCPVDGPHQSRDLVVLLFLG